MPTYYINADTGVDTPGGGTEGAPWLTLAYAVANSTTGDTIICQASTATYAFPDALNYANRTIQGATNDPSDAIFDAATLNREWVMTGAGNNHVTNLSNITLQNAHAASGGNPTGFPMFRPNDTSATGGVLTVTNVVFKNLTYNAGDPQRVGVFGGNFTVGSYTSVFNLCKFINCGYKASSSNTQVIAVGSGAGTVSITVQNCTFYFPSGANLPTQLFSVPGGSVTFVNKNNIMRSIDSMPFGTNGTSTYNCINGFTGAPSDPTNITDDPLFVDEDNDNFNLRPTSPCIDAGVLV